MAMARILGVLLILLGLTLLASPEIWYYQREKIELSSSTELTSKAERVLVIPRAVALLVLSAGAAALYLARRRT